MPPRPRNVLLVAVPALALAAWAGWPSPPAPPAPPREYDVAARPPDVIPPGTVVGRAAPAGWSHLVVKSMPRIREADRPKVTKYVDQMARWMFTAFLADVEPDPDRPGKHRVRAVALGLGAAAGDRDVVVTPDTAAQFGVDLGLVGGAILTAGYDRQRTAMVVLRGPTMALVDTPVCFRCGDAHRYVWVRYALLTDGPGGSLDVLAWRVDPAGGPCGDPGGVVWLRPDTVNEAELAVDVGAFNLIGKPSELAFAVSTLPPGRREVPLPAELRPLADRSRFTADEARQLEDGLRKLISP